MDLKPQLHNEKNLGEEAPKRAYLLSEFHGLRFLYSQRMLVSDDGWKFIFTPGDYDELYNLNDDPSELHNLLAEQNPLTTEIAKRLDTMRSALVEEMTRYKDPLRDCASKFQGNWTLESSQFDVTKAYLKTERD